MSTVTNINIWGSPNDGTWDTLRAWGQIINDNFNNLNIDKLESVVAWSGIAIDATDPINPIVSTTTWLDKTVTFVVTNAFLSWEIIDITDGTWATAWTTTRTNWDTWDITSLWISAAVFNADASLKVTDNKTIALTGTDVIWDTTTSFHFIRPLSIWEWFIIENGAPIWGWALWDTTIDWTLTVTGKISKTWSSIWRVITYVDDSGWSSTINLPTAVWLLNESYTYVRTDTSANITTLDPNSSETINNNVTFTFWKNESVTIISDNSNWFII